MASDTLLDIVNDILLMTGDHAKLASVIGSPANIAERYKAALNITIDDARVDILFPELQDDFSAVADGMNSQWEATSIVAEPGDVIAVSVGDNGDLEEITRALMQHYRSINYASGEPEYFTRGINSAGTGLMVDIYPTPPANEQITVIANKSPTYFILADTATTEINDNTLLQLGAIAHADAYAGMDRGYMQLYTSYKARKITHKNRNKQYRMTPEDYH